MELWDVRNTARTVIVICLISIQVIFQLIDSSKPIGSIFYIPLLCVGYMGATKIFVHFNESILQFMFSSFIALTSLMGSVQFMMWAHSPEYFKSTATKLEAVVLARMDNGEIPLAILFFLILPLVATPAGMDIRVVKLLTVANTTLYVTTTTFLWQRASTETHQIGVLHDFVVFTVILCACWFSCVPAAQAGIKIVDDLQAGRSADSVLNHILKNRISGAASLLEMLDNKEDETQNRLAIHKQALDQLYLSMKWCASRQFIIDVTSRQYQSVIAPVDTRSFVEDICFRDGRVRFVTNDETLSQQVDGKVLAFDKNMAMLACENAVTNSKSHGDGDVIRFSVSFDDGYVTFKIENFVSTEARVSTESLRAVLVESTSVTARKKPASTTSGPIVKTQAVKFSTQSGLKHIALACEAAKGKVDAHVTKLGTRVAVVVTLKFPAQLMVPDRKSTIRVKLPDEPVATEDELPTQLKVCAIDDSKLICKGYEKVLLSKINADRETSCVVWSKTRADIDAFLNKVIGEEGRKEGEDESSSKTAADIAILDQYLELPGLEPFYGTDLADTLRSRGFTGIVVIRSANASETDREHYMRSGAVDGCIGKDGSHSEVAEGIRHAWNSRKRRGPVS